jgi:hypothetical protein
MATTKKAPASKAATAKKAPAKKEEKTMEKKPNVCVCGCGRKVMKNFAPGHDARVYSILKKVGRGEADETAIPAAVRANKELLAAMVEKVH